MPDQTNEPDYVAEILEKYPEDVRDSLKGDLKKVSDTINGTKGQQEQTLKEQLGLLEENNRYLQSLVDEQKQTRSAVEATTADAVLAAELGMTDEQFVAFKGSMKKMGFVTDQELRSATTGTTEVLTRKENLQRELGNWESHFGKDVFTPYRKMIEGMAKNNDYDLSPYRDTLVDLAKDLQEQSAKAQMSKQTEVAARKSASTVEPSVPLLSDDKVVRDDYGNVDYHATFANLDLE